MLTKGFKHGDRLLFLDVKHNDGNGSIFKVVIDKFDNDLRMVFEHVSKGIADRYEVGSYVIFQSDEYLHLYTNQDTIQNKSAHVPVQNGVCCDAPNVILNNALGNTFHVCRNCKQEVTI